MQRTVRDELLYIAHHGNESAPHLIGHIYLFLDTLPLEDGAAHDFYPVITETVPSELIALQHSA